jgi:hypothetical protein
MPRYYFDVKDGHMRFDASGFVCENDTDAIGRATVPSAFLLAGAVSVAASKFLLADWPLKASCLAAMSTSRKVKAMEPACFHRTLRITSVAVFSRRQTAVGEQ